MRVIVVTSPKLPRHKKCRPNSNGRSSSPICLKYYTWHFISAPIKILWQLIIYISKSRLWTKSKTRLQILAGRNSPVSSRSGRSASATIRRQPWRISFYQSTRSWWRSIIYSSFYCIAIINRSFILSAYPSLYLNRKSSIMYYSLIC